MSDKASLTVRWDEEIVGYLAPQRKGRIKFSYAPEWIEKYNQPISLSLPCAEGQFDAQRSTAFFENLLPEENMFKELCREARIDVADTYSFLRRFGQECAGALVIVPEGEEPAPHASAYRDITDELESIVNRQHGIPRGSLIAETKARLSIAGAQNKLPVTVEGGRIFVPADGSYAPTTAILKPTSYLFPDLHRNELFCMELAREAGLQTPDAGLLQIGEYQAYVVMRYDRQQTERGIVRLHQEDFCQALSVSHEQKYEESGGPGFAACGKVLLHPLVSGHTEARENFVKCAVFNYIIGNCDAHAKNFSLLYNGNKELRLAPFYDLASTMAYPELAQKFAMAIGKTFRFDRVAEHSWKEFAAAMNIRAERVVSLAEEVCASIAPAVEPLAARHEKQYGASSIYGTLAQVIRTGLGQLARMAEGSNKA
jgi:serine/threonine-protein kinase HipA